MDAKMQRRIQRYGWDKAAERYETGWKASLAPAQAALVAEANAQPGERVVDLACGTGLVTLRLAEAVGPHGEVVGADISQAMVDTLKRCACAQGLHHIRAIRSDAESLPRFASGRADLVTCALGLMYVADPEAAIGEAFRMLKPGGRCVVAVWGNRAACGWADIFPIVDARVKSTVCPMFFRLGTGRALEGALKGAGFEAIHLNRLNTTLPYGDDRAALSAAFEAGPVALAYSRFDAATRADVHREYLSSISPFWQSGGYRIPGEFVIARGTKPCRE
ncbi:MAG: methyltransferase domain-containing protein [Pseudomonadota bacterium]